MQDTVNQTLSIMRGIKKYLKDSDCDECKKVLKSIFFEENKVTGSLLGDQQG
jgi:hypothetical protein